MPRHDQAQGEYVEKRVIRYINTPAQKPVPQGKGWETIGYSILGGVLVTYSVGKERGDYRVLRWDALVGNDHAGDWVKVRGFDEFENVQTACELLCQQAQDYFVKPGEQKGYLWDARREDLCARDNEEV